MGHNLIRMIQLAVLAVGAIYVLGRYEWLVLMILGAPLRVVRRLVTLVHVLLSRTRHALPRATRQLFSVALPVREDLQPPVWSGWPWVGSLVFLVVTVYLAGVDFYLLLLTFAAMDPSAPPPPKLPLPLDQMLALTSVVLAAFWGVLLLDALQLTHLGPFTNLSPRGRNAAKGLCVIAILAVLVTFGSLGFWRGVQVDQANYPPATTAMNQSASALTFVIDRAPADHALSDGLPNTVDPSSAPLSFADERTLRLIPIGVNTILPVLITASAVVAGWGIGGALVLLLGLLLVILAAIVNLASVLTNVLITACGALLGLLASALRILGSASRNAWNYVARTDPLGGGPWVHPVTSGGTVPESVETILRDSQVRVEAIANAFDHGADSQAAGASRRG